MATVAALGGNLSSTDNVSRTITATPTLGDLIVITAMSTGSTTATTPTDDNADGLGTYTEITAAACVKNASADQIRVFVRDAFIGSATSTIFTWASGTSTGGGMRIIRVAGMPSGRVGAAAVRQAGKEDNQAAATPAPVLPSAALTANATITAIHNATNPSGVTIPASWTVIGADQGYNSPATGARQAGRDSGFTGTTVTWGSASATAFCSTVIELDTSAVPTGTDYTDADTVYFLMTPSGSDDYTPGVAEKQSFYAYRRRSYR